MIIPQKGPAPTLKEIMIDAARYRWLREQNETLVGEDNRGETTFYVGCENGIDDFGWVGVNLDELIDGYLAAENE